MHLVRIRIHGGSFPTRRFYPFNIPVLEKTAELILKGSVIFFVGENGSGKSTLLDAVVRRCGVQVWEKPRRHLAHRNPYETKLADFVSITWANGRVPGSLFRAETFRDWADFLDDVALCDPGRLQHHGGRILNTMSRGEGILSYIRGRFSVNGLFFLDEPESALSPLSQITFLNLLRQFQAKGRAQFIIATHSPILLACPGAQILSFDSSHIKEVEYEDTLHFKLYRQFFTERAALLSV